jgi:hypothetical protein
MIFQLVKVEIDERNKRSPFPLEDYAPAPARVNFERGDLASSDRTR